VQRPAVAEVGVFRLHQLNQFSGAVQPLRPISEIADVGTRFIQHPTRLVVGGLGFAMAGDDHLGIKLLDGIQALQPALPATGTAQSEHRMDLVVDHITGDDRIEVGDVQDRAGPDVTLADFDDLQLVSFELDCQSIEGLWHVARLGNPVAEHRRPLLRFSLGRLVDVLHNRGRRDHACVGERGYQIAGAIPMVGVAVRYVDGRQLLARAPDEVGQRGHVRANVLCIDQHGVGFAGNER
jgi:hypothetical protein